MAWVWQRPKEADTWGADLDHHTEDASVFPNPRIYAPIPAHFVVPRFKSRTGLKKFKKLHSPPIGIDPVVDAVWRDIILKFVPADRVQFYPVRLIARGEICDDYTWVVPFDQVRCIDVERSVIPQKIVKPDITLIIRVDEYVHIPGCLQGKHLARDEQDLYHMVPSDELHDALAATGEHSMFYQPEDVPTLFGRNGILK